MAEPPEKVKDPRKYLQETRELGVNKRTRYYDRNWIQCHKSFVQPTCWNRIVGIDIGE
jgi:hypothetical protein